MSLNCRRVGHGVCLLLAISTTLLAQSVQGAPRGTPATNLNRGADISLQAQGVLRGQILDRQGQPLAQADIAITQNQKLIVYGKTDAAGRFAFRGLKPGAYQVQSAVAGRSVRLWAPQTAPPSAQQAMLIVADQDVARAQIDMNRYGPAIRGAIAGGLLTGLTYWAVDYNPSGS